jgi:hypothetical protein
MPYKIDKDIFIKNLIPEMSFQMKMASPKDFSTLVKKGKNIENGLLGKGPIEHYSSSSSNNDTSNNRKPKFWSKKKGVTHDGVTDVKSVQKLQGATTTITTIVTGTTKVQTVTIRIKKQSKQLAIS